MRSRVNFVRIIRNRFQEGDVHRASRPRQLVGIRTAVVGVYDENFCMGGPGVILSRETLARIVPHIKYCLRHLYTTHEDVELGRSVKKYAGIPSTWSYEVIASKCFLLHIRVDMLMHAITLNVTDEEFLFTNERNVAKYSEEIIYHKRGRGRERSFPNSAFSKK